MSNCQTRGAQSSLAVVSLAISLIGTLSLSSIVHAGNLTSSFGVENPSVLPNGIRNPQFKYVIVSPTNKFDGIGVPQPLGASLNKSLSWNEVIAGQGSETDKAIIAGAVSKLGQDLNDSPGSTSGEVFVDTRVLVPVLAYGISDRLTIAAALPVYQVDVKAKSGFVKTQKGDDFVLETAKTDTYAANEAANKFNNAVDNKLTELGYDPLQDQNFSHIGDGKIVAKYLALENEKNKFAIKGELTLPTGKEPNPNNPVDIATGDGQTDIGVTAIMSHQLNSWLSLNGYGGTTIQLPDETEVRVPNSNFDALSRDKETLSRNLGDIYHAGIGTGFGTSSRGLSFNLGYSFQFQNGTSFENGKLPSERYRFLEGKNPLQALHSATATLGFSTIDWYKSGRFFYPFTAALTYSKPLAGRNVISDSVVIADLIVFF